MRFLGFIFFLMLISGCDSSKVESGNYQSFQQFLDGNFQDWQGLSNQCSIPELKQHFDIPSDSGKWFLGQKTQDAWFHSYHPEKGEHVQIWFRNDSVLMLQRDSPELGESWDAPQKFRKKWGAPVLLPDYYGVMRVENGLHVYPEKGLAFSTTPEGTTISTLYAFPSTDSAGFYDDLYNHEPPEEFPVREFE